MEHHPTMLLVINGVIGWMGHSILLRITHFIPLQQWCPVTPFISHCLDKMPGCCPQSF